jgi:hypothetical protein
VSRPHHTATLEPAPSPERRSDRAARVLVAIAVAALLALALWPVLHEHGSAHPDDPPWEQLAPPDSVPMRTWRWLVISTGQRGAHLRLAPAPGDAARVEALSAWRLQQPIPGYPADAIVVAVAAHGDPLATERRLTGLSAALMGRIPTLAIARLGTDRLGPPPGVDQERLRFLVREHLGR